VPTLVKLAKENKMPAVALTDYSNMYGIIEFYKTCQKEGVKAIVGAEFSILHNERKFQIVLLAKNMAGYRNLMRITSLVNIENPLDPLLTDTVLSEYKDGLIVLSGGMMGDVNTLCVIDKRQALDRLRFYKNLFGEDYYLELNPQLKLDDGEVIFKKTIELAEETSTELIATWNSHYLDDADKYAHRILHLVHGDERSLEEYNHIF
jgi:DNA polymerase-3 subunit alpha